MIFIRIILRCSAFITGPICFQVRYGVPSRNHIAIALILFAPKIKKGLLCTRTKHIHDTNLKALMYDPISEGSEHLLHPHWKNQHSAMSLLRLSCPYMKEIYWMVISSPRLMSRWARRRTFRFFRTLCKVARFSIKKNVEDDSNRNVYYLIIV